MVWSGITKFGSVGGAGPGASVVGVSELVGLVLLPAVVGASELVGLGVAVTATAPPGVVGTENAELGAGGGPIGAALG